MTKIQTSLRECTVWSESLSGASIFTGRILDSQRCKVSSSGHRRLRGCVGWFESSLGAHVSRYVFSLCGLYVVTVLHFFFFFLQTVMIGYARSIFLLCCCFIKSWCYFVRYKWLTTLCCTCVSKGMVIIIVEIASCALLYLLILTR